MTATAAMSRGTTSDLSRVPSKELPWSDTAQRAPMMVATIGRYLDQLVAGGLDGEEAVRSR